ncbi:hypothetical protein K501DRAFT_280362 [Backusella circina FSU 941]|nr:hypothetical protein K501DRAFT_280362 [Backusella circina FSU 941]
MDQLPSDILNLIFTQLPFKQKKECMLVCQIWKDIIENRCLFHTLEISDEERFNEFMDLMKQTPSFRKQVVDLAVLTYWRVQDINNFIEYFPNLTNFSFTRRSEDQVHYVDSDATSKSRMRFIRDGDSCILLHAFVKAGLCSRLDEICLVSFEPEVLPILKDMPYLTTLLLQYSYVDIAQLEMLHKNLPTLKYIAVDIERFDYPIPTHIIPAVSITGLCVQMEYPSQNDQINWLLYVSKKYPNLTMYYPEIETRGYEPEEKEDFKSVFLRAYEPFLKSVGSQLTSINLPGAQFDNFEIFQKMDENGCQINTMILFSDEDNSWTSALPQSNQAKSLEYLTVHDTRPLLFDWLKSMKKLKSLCISTSSDEFEDSDKIDINMALESCSKTVKKIEINGGHYCVNSDVDDVFDIEEMRLDYGWAPTNIGQFIANCLPNLHTLSLNGSLHSDLNLILPNHHFSYVRLYFYEADKSHGNYALTTLKDSEQYRFRTKDKETLIEMSFYDKFIGPIPEDSFNGDPFIELVFGSVRKLILDDYQALLM